MLAFKQDSPTILQNGTGTPYLAIFNGQGQPIIDPKNNLPIGMFMTSFEYIYDEEDVDGGSFNIDTDNPDLAALEALDYYRPLILQWGYIYPSNQAYIGPLRKVMITGREVNFNETGTHITIQFSDASVILKNMPARYFENTSGFLKYIEDILLGKGLGIIMVDYRESSKYKQVVLEQTVGKEELRNNPDYKKLWTSQDTNSPVIMGGVNNPANQVYYFTHKASTLYPNQVGAVLLEANSNNLWLCENYPEVFRVANVEVGTAHNLIIKGNHPNLYKQIGEIFKWSKGGPYFLDGRDNKLTIHNQLVNRKVSKVYTYAGGNGELLQFQVSSEFVQTAVGVTKQDELTEGNAIQGVNTQSVNNSDGPSNVDVIVNWPSGGSYKKDILGTNWADEDSNVFTRGTNPDKGDYWHYGQLPPDSTNQPQTQAEYYTDPSVNNPINTQDTTMVYSSIQAAKEDITNHLILTKEEVEKFWSERKRTFEEFLLRGETEIDSEESYGHWLHEFQNLGELVIHRKVKIRTMVDARAYANPENQEQINAVLNGEQDFAGNVDIDPIYSTRNSSSKYKQGLEFLNSIGGITVIEDQSKVMKNWLNSVRRDSGQLSAQGYSAVRDSLAFKVILEYDGEVEIPLDGTRIVANYPVEWASNVFPQKIEEHLKSTHEASAVIVGDPCLESSMNILIQNVSKKYSGIWYTKKVEHKITPGDGYKCHIEFTQRTTDVVTNTATSQVDMISIMTRFQKLAKWLEKNKISVGITRDTTINKTSLHEAYKTWVKEQYSSSEKSTLVITGDDSLFDSNNSSSRVGWGLNGSVQVIQSDHAPSYTHPENYGGDPNVTWSPGDALDPQSDPNSDGAKNIQNQ